MTVCMVCGVAIELTRPNRRWCSRACGKRAWRAGLASPAPICTGEVGEVRCANCQAPFKPRRTNAICCSMQCSRRLRKIRWTTRRMVERAASGTINPARDRCCRGDYTIKEMAMLRADPLCVLPNRTLAAQWQHCRRLGIPRDPSLRVLYKDSPEVLARRAAAETKDKRAARHRRSRFRTWVRADPGPVLDELRRLAGRHPHAEDLIEEGFAMVLRLAIPAAEAFKLAKAEVNRTSAQPFRDQSFNPEIDYEARETGRQVARASDIRAVRNEG